MDRLNQYRQAIQTLLSQYAKNDCMTDDVDVQLLFDEHHDHYQWMNIGWQGANRIYRSIVHFDLIDGKIWLQQNLTDQNPAEALVEMGIPRDDIVLGLQPPYKRPFTDYGGAA